MPYTFNMDATISPRRITQCECRKPFTHNVGKIFERLAEPVAILDTKRNWVISICTPNRGEC